MNNWFKYIGIGFIALQSAGSMATGRLDTVFMSVKSFGAIGNGKADDTGPLLKCLQSATSKTNIVVVEIPYGIYDISKTLSCNIGNCPHLIIRGEAKKGVKPLIQTDKFITLLEITSYYWSTKGQVTVSGLRVKGNNVPFSSTHPYFDKPSYCSGIHVSNMEKAWILDNEVTNMYGDGILINYSNINPKDLNNRFNSIVVSDNRILNCWGLHPTKPQKGTYDDYGDGIYINSVKQGMISGNRIVNTLKETKQFGRAGIVLETNVEDCIVKDNYIFGYDRNIHLEADIGGETIENNVLEGSDFGILIYDVPMADNKPDTIIGNKISNRGLPLHNHLIRVRNSEERCLLSFFARDGCKKGSVVMDNQFVIYPGYDYKFASIARFLGTGIIVKRNRFISDLPPSIRKSVNFYLPVDSVVDNYVQNVDVHFAKPEPSQIVKGNQMSGVVKSDLNLR